MTTATPVAQLAALDGSSIDGGLYHWFITQAQHAPHWFDNLVSFYASYGLGLFAVLMVWCWWQARKARDAGAMALALTVPVTVVLAYVANDIVKSVFDEPRPCQVITSPATVQPCPGVGGPNCGSCRERRQVVPPGRDNHRIPAMSDHLQTPHDGCMGVDSTSQAKQIKPRSR